MDATQQKIERVKHEIQQLMERVRAIPGQECFTLSSEKIHDAARTIVVETIVGKKAKPDSTLFDMVGKVMGVVHRFRDDGLTLPDYLYAALSQPQLLTLKPKTVAHNILGVVDVFSGAGLKTANYIKAALEKPVLFMMPPKVVANNILNTVRYFEPAGLTFDAYLKAALNRPQLFYQSPDTLIGNITRVVNHFEKDGLTLPLYLEGATKNPALFSQSPATIIRHANILKKIFDSDKVTTSAQGFWPWLMQNPHLLSLADENLLTRSVLADCITVKTGSRTPINTLKESKSALAKRCGEMEIPKPCIETVQAIAEHMASKMKEKDMRRPTEIA